MNSRLDKEYDSFEHAYFNPALPGLPANYLLTLANGAKVTFGDIIALAGDCYGVPEKPICLGVTEAGRSSRFLAAYETMNSASAADINKLLAMFQGQRNTADKALAAGKSVAAAISGITAENTVQYMEYTRGKYLELADHNLDHFNQQAILAYKTGHRLSRLAAIDAHNIKDAVLKQEKLAYAYSLEAFACHFLTDHFAAGHIRTPRIELEKQFDPVIGSVLSLFMHNEDNNNGLAIAGKSGKDWRSLGDGHLFEKDCEDNKNKADEAVAMAVQEVFEAYETGQMNELADSKVYDLIPEAIEKNYSPMFKVDPKTGRVKYRTNLNDLNCQDYQDLTAEAVLKILDHFADQYIDDDILQGKISQIRKKFTADEKAVKHTLLDLSIFNCCRRSKPGKDEQNNKKAFPSCLIL